MAPLPPCNFRIFSIPKEIPYPLLFTLLFPLFPSLWQPLIFLNFSLWICLLDISYKYNHTICDLL